VEEDLLCNELIKNKINGIILILYVLFMNIVYEFYQITIKFGYCCWSDTGKNRH